jgi:hypothetical protein
MGLKGVICAPAGRLLVAGHRVADAGIGVFSAPGVVAWWRFARSMDP